MKDTTKTTLKNVFASLIKNDSAIEGAKTAPWWIGVILFVIGTFLPVIPIMVNTSKTYGASYISSYVYGYEQGLATCGVQLKTEKYSFNVENKNLVMKIDGVAQTKTYEEVNGVIADETPIARYETNIKGVKQYAFEMYYSDRPYSGSTKSITSLIKLIESKQYVVGTEEIYNSEVHDKKTTKYTPSYLILYKTGMYSKIYKNNTTTVSTATYSGLDWKNAKFDELLDCLLTVEGVEQNLLDINYVNGVLNNLKKVSNDAYINQKNYNFWFQSGLYYGIYLILGFFMGFMMWLLTRGKNNPNRNLSIFVAFEISWWITFTPGLLAMILGFMWSAAAGLAYIVLIGLRTMWLSMRSLNPSTAAR